MFQFIGWKRSDIRHYFSLPKNVNLNGVFEKRSRESITSAKYLVLELLQYWRTITLTSLGTLRKLVYGRSVFLSNR